MRIPLCLAMTPEEIADCSAYPADMAYMACHVASHGPDDCPAALPPDATLILNDSIPVSSIDPPHFAAKLTETAQRLGCSRLLLDFERTGVPEAAALAAAVSREFPGRVGVSAPYADALPVPVFLPPPPCHMTLQEYLAPWRGREIWLEAAFTPTVLTLTPEGCHVQAACAKSAAPVHMDPHLHCHYQILSGETVRFFLYRTPEDLQELADEAQEYGVTRMIGLYQELRGIQDTGAVSGVCSAGTQPLPSL